MTFNRIQTDPDPPLFHRLVLKLGHPLGLRFNSGRKVTLITQMEKSLRLQGKGFYWIHPAIQRVRAVVSTAPEHDVFAMPNVPTRDGLMFGLKAQLEYYFDPLHLPHREGIGAVKQYPESAQRREYVQGQAVRVIQEILSSFNAEELSRSGEVFKTVEKLFLDVLVPRLWISGIRLIRDKSFVLDPELPPGLLTQFDKTAQRSNEAQDLTQYPAGIWHRLKESGTLDAMKNSKGLLPIIGADRMLDPSSASELPPMVNGRAEPPQAVPPPQTTRDETPPARSLIEIKPRKKPSRLS